MTTAIPRDAATPEPLADEDIVRRVLRGERDLYELLMRRHNQRVYRAVRSVLRDENDVEDVMQQAYVQAYLHLDQFAGLARFSTWLVRIAVNEARARTRGRSRLVLVGDDPEQAEGPMTTAAGGRSPEDEAGSREMVLLVERALDQLPEMYRTALVLREIEGLSTAEVAGALDITEDVVKTRVHRARAMLQTTVRASDHELTGAFPFGARRCNRMVDGVLARLAALTER